MRYLMYFLFDKFPRPLFTLPISSSLINVLSKNGFSSWEDIVNDGDCDEKVEQILASHKMTWEELKNLVEPPPLRSFNQVFKAEAMKLSIPTFSEVLDSKLNGGIPTGTVIHVCGPPGSGKTQFALQLCICVQIPSCLCGLTGEAVFIDTDSGFSISRLSEISESVVNHCRRVAELHNLEDDIRDFTLESILDRIHYIEIGSSLELLSSVQLLDNLIAKNSKIKLIVIDSLLFPFHNCSNTLERTRMISSLISQLYSLAIKFDITVIVTNHVATRMSGNERTIIPALGESFLHHVPITLFLNKTGNNTYTCLIQKANDLPDSLVLFKVTSGGIRDHNA